MREFEYEFERVNVEDEEDLGEIETTEFAEATIAHTDWTVETVVSQMRRNNIELSPTFQRREAWRADRKSKFIESLVLGIPVPPLVLAERKDGKGRFIVIDGKQRLLTLRQFAAKADDNFDQFRLTKLQFRPELEGATLEDLEADEDRKSTVDAFLNAPIRCVIIRAWPSEEFLWLVFLRLNSGSLPLSSQELRQAMHPGAFLTYADDWTSKSELMMSALGASRPDFRMRDVELFVRYFAFRNFLDDYAGNLKRFLDDACKKLNKRWDEERGLIERQAAGLEKAIATTSDIFGAENAFSVFREGQYQGRFNRAVFDVMCFYFNVKDISKKALDLKSNVRVAFEELCAESEDFTRSLETTTKSVTATYTRLKLWGGKLAKTLKMRLHVPELKGKRIVVK